VVFLERPEPVIQNKIGQGIELQRGAYDTLFCGFNHGKLNGKILCKSMSLAPNKST